MNRAIITVFTILVVLVGLRNWPESGLVAWKVSHAVYNAAMETTSTPQAVDFTIAMDCKVLKGSGAPFGSSELGYLRTTIEEYENNLHNLQTRSMDTNTFMEWSGKQGVMSYAPSEPLILEHGWPPTKVPTTQATDRLHVSEVTSTAVILSGRWNGEIMTGYLDRRTGEGRIKWAWDHDGQNPDGTYVFHKGQLDRDYLLSCKPAKPTMF